MLASVSTSFLGFEYALLMIAPEKGARCATRSATRLYFCVSVLIRMPCNQAA